MQSHVLLHQMELLLGWEHRELVQLDVQRGSLEKILHWEQIFSLHEFRHASVLLRLNLKKRIINVLVNNKHLRGVLVQLCLPLLSCLLLSRILEQ